MKISGVWALCVVIALVSSVAGYKHAEERIQESCEADEGTTVVNGTAYLCLSDRHLQMLREQTHKRVKEA